jgi:hypothetical protein
MTQIARDTYLLSGEDITDIKNNMNFILQRIADRLDQIEGLRGTASINSDLDLNGNSLLNVANLDLTGTETDEFLTNLYTFTAPSSLTLVAGTSTGTISDIQTLNDGNEYDLEEATGTPGQDLRLEFTGMSGVKGLVTKMYYSGGATHYVSIDLYNYSTLAFDTLLNVTDADNHNLRTVLIPDGTNYRNQDGDAVVRIYHPLAGVASHDSYIEYAALLN